MTDRSDYNKIIHQYCFYPVLKEIEKKCRTEIEIHKEKMESCLYKIRNIHWIVVDNDKYNSVYFPKKTSENTKPCLEMSRYVHISLDECYPNSRECIECFKYHCICCGQGTNSMYGGYCSSRRCSNTLNKISFFKEDIIIPKRVYVFGYHQ